VRGGARRRDDRAGHDRHQHGPGDVGAAHGRVAGQLREREHRILDAGPVVDAGEHQRGGARCQEAGHERPAQRGGGHDGLRGGELEEQQRRRERPAEHRADGRERAGHDDEPAGGLVGAQDPSGDQPERQAEREQRRLRAEHEAEAERRERGQQHADEPEWRDWFEAQVAGGGMAGVARHPQRDRDEHPGDQRQQHDVPRGRRAPARGIGDLGPCQLGHAVDGGHQPGRRDRHGRPEGRGDQEHPAVLPGRQRWGRRAHGGGTLGRPGAAPAIPIG
jgi:hypothetical protein